MIIYKMTNMVNNKSYIGQTTKTFNERYYSRGVGMERVYNYHSSLKNLGRSYNEHLLRAIEKYGVDNFTIEILEVCKTQSSLNKREEYFIKLFKTCNPKFGYNSTKGGDGIKRTKIMNDRIKENRRMTSINAVSDLYKSTKVEEVILDINKDIFKELSKYEKRILLVILCYFSVGLKEIKASTLKKFVKVNCYARFYEQVDKINKNGFVNIGINKEKKLLKIELQEDIFNNPNLKILIKTKYKIEMEAYIEVNSGFFGRNITIRKCLSCGREAAFSSSGNKKYCDCCPRGTRREKENAEKKNLYYSNPKEYIKQLYEVA